MSTLTATDFERGLRASRPGTTIVYHTGLLMRDRLFDPELNKLGKRVFKLFEDGWCALYQRRVGAGICEYQAVRKERRATA